MAVFANFFNAQIFRLGLKTAFCNRLFIYSTSSVMVALKASRTNFFDFLVLDIIEPPPLGIIYES